ncbi:unnamed protein product [Paramecium octaurelia]|uniref:Anoctamin transmembrane domain-containing protein n=1 Tax=Paramecium octaurelia TaxID=43137 RepID=A0A8S1XYC2_PAROT|nr:unnamed protein product [Paramecium octaurelia]
MQITQTQLLEWVKDGNKVTLKKHLEDELKFSQNKVHDFFAMVDDQRRNVVHWAAYLGQYKLLKWWCKKYKLMIDLNKGDMHSYTPLELASIKGYSGEYNPEQQENTIRLLLDHGAQIPQSNTSKPNPLHWAFYYGNKELVDFLISKKFQLQLETDQQGNYPIDYLFLENRPDQYKKEVSDIFENVIINYAQIITKQTLNRKPKKKKVRQPIKKKNRQFKEEKPHQGTIVMSQLPFIQTQGKDDESSPESEPSKNGIPYSNISNYHRSQTSNSFISKNTLPKSSQKSTQNQQILNKFQQRSCGQKIQSKNLDEIADVPLYDDSRIEMKEPEEEKIPEIKIFNQNPRNPNSQKLIPEKNQESQFKADECNIIINQPPTILFNQETSPPKVFDHRRHHKSNKFKSQNEEDMEKIHLKEQDKYFIYHSNANLTKNETYECRLQYWSARQGNTEFLIYFLKRRCNPFLNVYQGFNCLHIAAFKGKLKILKILLEAEYEYYDYSGESNHKNKKQLKDQIFNKKECINILTDQNPSNALHLAIEQEKYKCMKTLILHGVSVDTVNSRCLKPFELTFNQDIMEYYKENIQTKQQMSSLTELGYQYVIQTRGTLSVEQDIVYLQLQNIRQTFKDRGWSFEFMIFHAPDLEKLEMYNDSAQAKKVKSLFHYYVLKLPPDSIYKLADLYQISCYNFQTKYICQFDYDNRGFFEFPKDLQVQMLILNTLNDEFDVDKFVLEKLIIAHYPLEDIQKCEKITQFWDEQQNNCIQDSIRYETQQIALRPLHAIASYFGPVVAWYIALNVQIIGWLMIPSVFGAALGIYIIITKEVNSSIVPFYALLMTLWSTLFMEKWKNRESELKFCWDMHKFRQTQPQRVMYTGQYIINEATNKIQIYDYFTTFKRRLIAEGPVILIGIAIIVVSFYAFNLWLQQWQGNTVMPIVINSLNGVSMTVFCDLYKRLCTSLVTWENHMYESEQEYSYILKVFLFEFLISYVSVVYVAIFQSDASQLSVSVASIIITRGVISNVTSNFLPYFFFKQEKKMFSDKFFEFKRIFQLKSAEKKQVHNICNSKFSTDKLNSEVQLQFLQELEIGRIKQPQKVLYDEYTSIAIQFGYTTMFAPTFPAAPLFFMINCYINLRWSIYNYQHILKRERAQAADSIGIWLQIFEIMNYCATFMNCIVIGTVNKEQFKGIIGNQNALVSAFFLAAIEHVLLLIKYILDVSIPDCPYWVEKELRRYAYLEEKYSKNNN